MTPAAEPRRDREEVARLAHEIYERRIEPLLRPEDRDKFVAVDVLTGEYDIDASDYVAVARLCARVPAAHAFLMRVGHPAAYRLRGHR